MTKYRDQSSLGRSGIAPFLPGEDPKHRHARRKDTNLEMRNVILAWCQENRCMLRINNDGHHWIVERVGFVAEWWPSSAKLVFNKEWANGIHCHDVLQFKRALDKKAPGQEVQDRGEEGERASS